MSSNGLSQMHVGYLKKQQSHYMLQERVLPAKAAAAESLSQGPVRGTNTGATGR